jgi:starvation-inducible DNA-binding protein
MNPTKNDLPLDTRKKVIAVLTGRLADAIDLQLQAKQVHWNVKGPAFFSLHKLFDEVAESTAESVDEVAERIVQLGGVADGTLAGITKRTALPALAPDVTGGEQCAAALAAALATFARGTRAAVDEVDELGDAVTADLFTEVAARADKYLWFVEAHLQRA